jgi:hypothetical protein
MDDDFLHYYFRVLNDDRNPDFELEPFAYCVPTDRD